MLKYYLVKHLLNYLYELFDCQYRRFSSDRWHYWLQQKLPEVLTMSSNQQFLQNLYEAFNNRELETIISVMHLDVKWANGVEGGFVYGRDAVREYWTNQYNVIQVQLENLKV